VDLAHKWTSPIALVSIVYTAFYVTKFGIAGSSR